ncbi:hypothetical protein L228DRAFT_250207 [Xylona heveae TC161]|uniref:Tim44-like domain-containing protein n=1 Tax=Xylona heveae (strain CBS 132557 / TC161) TaxID=1328760 RepID=A0A165AHV3_XYLHT|nr:hypothetical protein L228DRAFT_250207 [Xylona heveae TC161]KZF20500.1 hypothetical protein L228DRAFT_250207 [Xylona heveae TC161]
MAHCARWRVSNLATNYSTCIFNRSFSTSRIALGVTKPEMFAPQIRQPPQRSLKVAMKELEGAGQLPTDLGLLEGTFVTPTGENRPSLFRKPRDCATLFTLWLKTRITDFISVMYYKFAQKPRLKLQLRQTVPAARSLHREMYTAFANGDVETLRSICADGILHSFRARIAARGKDKLRWELHKYLRGARVISHRAAKLPIDGAGLRQAVVRLKSRQSLARLRPDNTAVPGTGIQRDVTEYVVIQRTMMNGKEGPWIVWGTTEETTVDKVKAAQKAITGQ